MRFCIALSALPSYHGVTRALLHLTTFLHLPRALRPEQSERRGILPGSEPVARDVWGQCRGQPHGYVAEECVSDHWFAFYFVTDHDRAILLAQRREIGRTQNMSTFAAALSLPRQTRAPQLFCLISELPLPCRTLGALQLML